MVANYEAEKKWTNMNNRAMKRIMFAIDTKQLVRIGGCRTAWDKSSWLISIAT